MYCYFIFLVSFKGILDINVTKDVYDELGLEGRTVTRREKKRDGLLHRYIISIDMTDDDFRPGKKRYDRVAWCLTDRLNLTSDFFVTWLPKDDKICPSSIGAYFTRCGFTSTEVKQRRKCKRKQLKIPIVNSTSPDESEDCCGYEDFYEWLGMVACDCDLSETADSYINSYRCPTPCHDVTPLSSIRLGGFYAPQTIGSIASHLRESMKKRDWPWVSLTVHGMQWPSTLTGLTHRTARVHTFVFFSDDRYWLFSNEPV